VELDRLIREELGRIEETFDSVHEIKNIANDILIHISKENFKLYNEYGKFMYIQGAYLKNVPLKTKPTALLQFVTQSQLYIDFDAKKEGMEKDGYYRADLNNRSLFKETEITLLYDKESIGAKINEAMSKDHYSQNSIYTIFYYQFISSLIHELQHAFDDFRSRGKAYSTKQSKNYFKKYLDQNNREIKMADLDPENALKKFREYLKLPHEIWARFAQAFERINFYKIDWDDDGKGGIKVTVKMEPLRESISDLKYRMPNFSVLDEKVKQRLYKAVIAYWHRAQELLPAYQKLQQQRFNGESKGDLSDMNENQNTKIVVDFVSGKILLNDNPVGIVELYDRGDGYVSLDKLLIYEEARGQGYASQAMKQIIDKYRAEHKILTLTPDHVYGGNTNKLIRWYRSLGFVLNKGKNKDFKTMQLMYLPLS
jgi:GNAT superfamily N-acetyltransferase